VSDNMISIAEGRIFGFNSSPKRSNYHILKVKRYENMAMLSNVVADELTVSVTAILFILSHLNYI
jgi:hypothetical protein